MSRKQSTARSHLSAFTLIELSIVLVIIGLIVGGVLVGQSLIAQAQIRAQVTQLQKFQEAVTTFEVKYSCKPGDCANATFLGIDGCGSFQNGNGDGILEGYYGGAWPLEQFIVFLHLNSAGLFSGTNLGYGLAYPACGNIGQGWGPLSAIGNGSILSVVSYGASATPLLIISLFQNHGWASRALTTNQAAGIDAKMDDGLPGSGKFQSFGDSSTGNYDNVAFFSSFGPTGDGVSCIADDVTPNAYNLKNTGSDLCLGGYFFDF